MNVSGSILPEDDMNEKFSQFYIFDNTEESTKARSKEFPNISQSLIYKIDHCLKENNKLIKKYKQISTQVLKDANYQMIIKDDYPNIDIRVYNQAAPNQIAAIIPNTTSIKNPRDIIVQQKNKSFQRISHLHAAYLPLSYILFFPNGEMGYNTRLYYLDNNNRPKRITLRSYINYYLQLRKNNFNILFKGGKLTLQLFVDMYCAVESEQLSWYKNNQKQIKADSYIGLIEAHRRNESLENIGIRRSS